MAMDDFDQELSLVPDMGQVCLHKNGTVTIQISLCDAADESKVLGNRSLTVPSSGNILNDRGEDCGAPASDLVDAIDAFKAALETLVNAKGQAGKLNI